MSIELVAPDFTTAEGAKKALVDLHTVARELRDENGILKANQADMVRDLKAANQALAELQRAPAGTHAGGSDLELKAFVGENGKLRIRGEATDSEGWAPGLVDAAPVNAWHEDFQRAVEERNIVKAIRKGKSTPKADARLRHVIARAPATVARAFADAAGVGAEWIPDVMLPTLEREFTAGRRVAGLFQSVPMSNKTVLLPFLSSGLRPYLKGTVTTDDPAAYASSSLTTAQRSIEAQGFAVRCQCDEDAAEDSIIDGLDIIRQELVTAIIDGEEDAIINGDTAGTHQDTIASWNIRSRWGATGLGTAADHRKPWIGLRARAFDVSNATDQTAAQTSAGFLTARNNLASPHGVSGSLISVTGPEYYVAKMMGFAEVITVDKFGPQATVLTGQLSALYGVPIIISEFMGADMNASGIYDNATMNKTGMLMFNRDRFKIGVRRGSTVEIDKDIVSGIHNLVQTLRETFFTVDSSTKKNVHYSYNLSIS